MEDPDRLVVGRRGELEAVGEDSHATDLTFVAPQCEELLPGERIPHSGRLVNGRRGELIWRHIYIYIYIRIKQI